MGFLVLLGSSLLLAIGILRTVPAGSGAAGERAGLLVLLWFAVLLGGDWLLAVSRTFTAGGLWGCSAGFLALGAWLVLRDGGWRSRPELRQPGPLVLIALAALFAAFLYVLVRGTLIYPDEFDALTYHLPKAVEIVRARGIPRLPCGDFRVTYFPWNYELILADALLLTPGDLLAHLGSVMAGAGFLAAAYGIFRKAWPRATPRECLFAMLFMAATPVLILHYGDYKNDLMFSFFLLEFLYWSTVWGEEGGSHRLFLAALSLGLGFGTKATSLFLLPGFCLYLWLHRARLRPEPGGWPRRLLVWTGVALALLVLTGSAWPVYNQVRFGHLLGDTAMVSGIPGYDANAVPKYIGFANIWRFPVLVLLRPFSAKIDGVWVFWRHRYEWWPGLHPIYSHFGWLCSVLLLAVPAGVVSHRREQGAGFRIGLTLYALIFVLFALPQRYRVDGMYCGFPRYLLCLPLLVALWAIPPVLMRLRGRWRGLAQQGAALLLIAYFLGQGYRYLTKDTTKSLEIVDFYMQNPGVHIIESISFELDKVAGPGDAVALDGGFGAMVYPLYGSGYTRPVTFLPRGAGAGSIPSQARWVVLDRRWNVGWGHPGVTTTADFWLPIRSAPSREDLDLFAQLSADPRFTLVLLGKGTGEAVFQRRPGQDAATRGSHGD